MGCRSITATRRARQQGCAYPYDRTDDRPKPKGHHHHHSLHLSVSQNILGRNDLAPFRGLLEDTSSPRHVYICPVFHFLGNIYE